MTSRNLFLSAVLPTEGLYCVVGLKRGTPRQVFAETLDKTVSIVDELVEDNFDVYFLSTPVYKLPESYASKRIWIKNNFGDWADKRLILTHRKDLCIGDYLIDDRLKNGSENFKGIHLHFGKVSPFYGSLRNWKDVIGVIKRREMI